MDSIVLVAHHDRHEREVIGVDWRGYGAGMSLNIGLNPQPFPLLDNDCGQL